jgi:hypothetical protein
MGKFILRSFKILQLSVKLILEFDHILGLTVKLGFGEKLEGLWERNLRINSEGHLMWFSFSHALLLPWLLFHQRIIGDFLPPSLLPIHIEPCLLNSSCFEFPFIFLSCY